MTDLQGTALRTKLAVARASTHPVVGRAAARVLGDRIPNRGIRFDTSDPQITPRVKARLLFGLYEGAELRFIGRHLDGRRDVVELGSSLGITGSHILRALAPGRRLIAVEANPALIDLLGRTLAAHAGTSNWAVEHGAIAYGTDEVLLQVGASTQGSRVADPDRDSATTVVVPATTLSGVLDHHGVDRYDLVCDIEGAEVDLLDLEDEALSRCDRMVIELHPTPTVSLADVRSTLTERHGFEVLDERGPVLVLGR